MGMSSPFTGQAPVPCPPGYVDMRDTKCRPVKATEVAPFLPSELVHVHLLPLGS